MCEVFKEWGRVRGSPPTFLAVLMEDLGCQQAQTPHNTPVPTQAWLRAAGLECSHKRKLEATASYLMPLSDQWAWSGPAH